MIQLPNFIPSALRGLWFKDQALGWVMPCQIWLFSLHRPFPKETMLVIGFGIFKELYTDVIKLQGLNALLSILLQK